MALFHEHHHHDHHHHQKNTDRQKQEPRNVERTMYFLDNLGAMERSDKNKFEQYMVAFYSKQKQQKEGGYVSTDPEKFANLLEDHCVESMTLRQAHDTSRRRIVELESELVEMRAKKQAESFIFPLNNTNPFASPVAAKAMGNNSTPLTSINMVHLEENRRHERQAALAIAEHDAVLIRKLEGEIVSLRSQHESDVRLVKDCAERVTKLLRENEEKEMRLSLSETAAQRLQTQITSMTDQLRTVELHLQHEKSSNLSRLDEKRIVKDDTLHNLLTVDATNNGGIEKYLVNPNESESMAKVRAENIRLRAALAHETNRLRDQEEAFVRVKVSAEEITLLEAEEIARLETELDKALDDKEHWQKRCKTAEHQFLLLQQEYQELVKSINPQRSAISLENNKDMSNRGTPMRNSQKSNYEDSSAYLGITNSSSYQPNHLSMSTPHSTPHSYDRQGQQYGSNIREHLEGTSSTNLPNLLERMQDFETRLQKPMFER